MWVQVPSGVHRGNMKDNKKWCPKVQIGLGRSPGDGWNHYFSNRGTYDSKLWEIDTNCIEEDCGCWNFVKKRCGLIRMR